MFKDGPLLLKNALHFQKFAYVRTALFIGFNLF